MGELHKPLIEILEEISDYGVSIEVQHKLAGQYNVIIEKKTSYWFWGFWKKRKARRVFKKLAKVIKETLYEGSDDKCMPMCWSRVEYRGLIKEVYTIQLFFTLEHSPVSEIKEYFEMICSEQVERFITLHNESMDVKYNSLNVYYYFSN